jgi:2-keto-4-pentenoate hydratase
MADAQAIATAFVEARRAARALVSYPGAAPIDLCAAYRIQDAAIVLDGRPITGWKVGRINAPLDRELGSNRLAGPIFGETVVALTNGEVPVMPVFADGFAAAEAELLLHIAPGMADARPVTDAETRLVIDEVRLGIEIASSPYPGINADGPAVTTSDFGNNHGLVMGAPLAGWQEIDLCAIPVRTLIDGAVIGEATAATMLDGPYGAVRFLLANLAERGIDISGGTWVSTGAITGVHQVVPGQSALAEFGSYGSVHCTIGAA